MRARIALALAALLACTPAMATGGYVPSTIPLVAAQPTRSMEQARLEACKEASDGMKATAGKARRAARSRYTKLGCAAPAPLAGEPARVAAAVDCSFLRHVMNQGSTPRDTASRLRAEHARSCRP